MSIIGSAHSLYPTILLFGVVHLQGGIVEEIPPRFPFKGEWGEQKSYHIPEQEISLSPVFLDIVYLSIVERKCYSITKRIPDKHLFSSEENSDIIVGMAPYGSLVLWLHNDKKSGILFRCSGDEINVSEDDFLPYDQPVNTEKLCDKFLNQEKDAQNNLNKNGLPPHDLFDNYMKQFTYRYQVVFEQWNKDEENWMKYYEEKDGVIPEFEYIEEALFDGTHDKLHDGGLMKYHEAGKPKKLALKWHIKKSDYSAYFWFEEEEICAIFNKFYGQHPDTKADFNIRIDPIKKKYELSLYRYGLQEPVIIPESAYQLIVLKSGFENYRSDNYNQESGAWVW